MHRNKLTTAVLAAVISLVTLCWSSAVCADDETFSLNMRNVSIAEVMELISRRSRTNIVLTNGVEGNVSINLYDMDLERAVNAVADAAGYAVESRNGGFFIVSRDDAGKFADGGLTDIRKFPLSYIEADAVAAAITPFLSNYGDIIAIPENRLVIVRDTPIFLERITDIMATLDRKPRQVLIEAKILEITLDDETSYGVDWSRFFTSQDGEGSFGTQGLSAPGSTGAFFSLSRDKLTIALDALHGRGKVRTLSSPQLLALENKEASVVIGDRQGFRVTTTINQVTTESIEFLESGVILHVTPRIDAAGDIMLNIHPEVSNGTITDGIPSQTTTEVTTQLLVRDGSSAFIGGLIKNTLSQSRTGVPVLSSIPGIRKVFSRTRSNAVNTETIVIITPRLVDTSEMEWQEQPREVLDEHEQVLELDKQDNEKDI